MYVCETKIVLCVAAIQIEAVILIVIVHIQHVFAILIGVVMSVMKKKTPKCYDNRNDRRRLNN